MTDDRILVDILKEYCFGAKSYNSCLTENLLQHNTLLIFESALSFSGCSAFVSGVGVILLKTNGIAIFQGKKMRKKTYPCPRLHMKQVAIDFHTKLSVIISCSTWNHFIIYKELIK